MISPRWCFSYGLPLCKISILEELRQILKMKKDNFVYDLGAHFISRLYKQHQTNSWKI